MAFPVMVIAVLYTGFAQQTDDVSRISGRVVNALTGAPVRRAAVRIHNPRLRVDEYTDGEGRFSFRGLTAGAYSVVARRDGFSTRTYLIGNEDFKARRPLVIELTPQGVIAGKVVDGMGLPLERVHITASAYRFRGGKRELVELSGSVQTNDKGEYRLSGLDPGSYFVRASFRGGRTDLYDITPITWAATTYGSEGGEGTAIRIHPGSEVPGIDFRLTPSAPHKIQGTVRTANGAPVASASLWITPLDPTSPILRGTSGHARDGRFTLSGIVPGRYLVSGEATNGSPTFGIVEVQVGMQNVDGVDLVLRPTARIQGKVRIAEQPDAAFKTLSILFRRTDGIQSFSRGYYSTFEGGAFATILNPGEYTFELRPLPPKTYVRSIRVAGKESAGSTIKIDSSEEPQSLEIILSNAAGAISGSVDLEHRELREPRRVILLPDATRRLNLRLFRTTQTDFAGRFSFTVVAPGVYTLISTRVDDGEWLAPEFWKLAEERGVKIEVKANETIEVKLDFIRPGGVQR